MAVKAISPDRANGITLSFRARVVMAHLLRDLSSNTDFDMSNYATERGLTRSFFLNGVNDLIDVGWISSESNGKLTLGLDCEIEGELSSWQSSLADYLMFPGSVCERSEWLDGKLTRLASSRQASVKKIPSHLEMVLLYLVISATSYGVIPNVTYHDIADCCGIARSSVRNKLKILQEYGFLKYYPGGNSRAVHDSWISINSVYVLSRQLIQCMNTDYVPLPVALEDLNSDDLLMLSPGASGSWFEIWPKQFSSLIPTSIIINDDQDKKVYEGLSDAITDQAKLNVLARIVSAANFILLHGDLNAQLQEVVDGREPMTAVVLARIMRALDVSSLCAVVPVVSGGYEISGNQNETVVMAMLRKTIGLQAVRMATNVLINRGHQRMAAEAMSRKQNSQSKEDAGDPSK